MKIIKGENGTKLRLTKKKADELCYELWDWLYKNPSKFKEDWPRWEFNGGDVPQVFSECFYCHLYQKYPYTNGLIRRGCTDCPLAQANTSCIDDDSYFRGWSEPTRTTYTIYRIKKYAKLIRDIAGVRLGKDGTE